MIVIETIEVLVRQYELNSIDNNNSYTTRNRNRERMAEAKAKSQAKMEAEKEDDDDDENKSSKGSEINQSADKEATGSLKREEPEESREGEEEEEEEKQQSTGTTLFVPSENVMRSISSMVLSKGEHIGRGHTAYLTFATKL